MLMAPSMAPGMTVALVPKAGVINYPHRLRTFRYNTHLKEHDKLRHQPLKNHMSITMVIPRS